MKITKEPFSLPLLAELLPLAQRCWEDSTVAKAETCAFYGERDFQIEPDVEQYQLLEKVGKLVIFTLRDPSGLLVGYMTGVWNRSLHHCKVIFGISDSIYTAPGYHTYAPIMVGYFEREMKARGAGIVGVSVHTNGPLYKMLVAMGYVGDELQMEKRLCA